MYLSFQIFLLALIAGVANTQRACEDDEFLCESGECIPMGWKCDQVIDCVSGDDEKGCNYTCSADQFQCELTRLCLPLDFLCNDNFDCCENSDNCEDKSDENSCSTSCSSDQFACTDNADKCIPILWRCDYYSDCGDNSDEKGCSYPTCAVNQFTCDDGNCIDSQKYCDGYPDCYDSSDEKLLCGTPNPSSTPPVCQINEFSCKSSECIPLAFQCDGHSHCADGSDEGSSCRNFTCSGVEFTCTSGLCIPVNWLCDGTTDCEDNGDEEGCDYSSKVCPPMHWPCPENGDCIHIDSLCDGSNDCPEGNDENGASCGTDQCSQLSCEYQCHSSPDGGVCYCGAGYVWDTEQFKCVDYDECAVYGTCDQFCQNELGSYKCSCGEGFQLQNGKTCKPLGEPGRILLSAKSEILSMDTRGGDIKVIAQSADAMGLDYHYEKKKVYWTDDSHEKVFAANIDGSGTTETLLELGLTIPVDIAVDWVGDKLYIAESMSDRIDACELDGRWRSGVITDNLKRPRGLALDPTEGYMFFSEHEDPARIERAYMDGTNRIHLVTDKVYWPYGITADIPAKRIYWLDGRLDYVGTVTYDGLYRETIASGSQVLPYPFHVALFEDYIYLTDWTLLALLRVNKLDIENNVPEIVYSLKDSRPDGVAAYHETKQPAAANPCGSNNGECDHLCLISHRTDNSGLGYRCKCGIGYELDTDQKSCKEVNTFLLFSTLVNIRGVSLEGSHQDAMSPIAEPTTNYEAIGYSAPDEYVYFSFSDTFGHALSRVKLDGTGLEHLVADIAVYVDAISIDWISRHYYWVDSYYGILFVAQMEDTQGIKEWRNLVSGIIGAYGLAVDPVEGYLFWSSVAGNSLIMRTWMDGSTPTAIINTALGEPHGLAIDYTTSRIYWTDALLNKIEFSDYDGNGRTTLSIQEIAAPWGIAIYGEHLYFSELRLSAIQRVNKITGGDEAPFVENLDNPRELNLYDSNLHQGDTNYCSDNSNAGCSHFCFPIPGGIRVCGCPYGLMLDTDNQNCIDNPDEPPLTCPSGAYECPVNGRCININYVCDGDNDCLDNTDEQNCTYSCAPSPYGFTCNDGSCVTGSSQCDGDDDCADSSDEVGCPPETCTSEEFQCPEDGKCISVYWRCDTIRDCKNGSDEIGCDDFECAVDQFSCETIQQCIPLEWECDGTIECPDGSDEHPDCGPIGCKDDEFTCANQECIDDDYTCDGIYDCSDFSDETGCPTRPTGGCHSDEIQCQTSGVCLPGSWRCDAYPDCDDGSDESGCFTDPPFTGTCSSDEFTCSDGNCIPEYYECDFYDDCPDSSDEGTAAGCDEDCPDYDYSFNFNTWTWEPYLVWECPETHECIPESWVCDGWLDCGNGEDEGDACNTDQCENDNAGCEQVCFMTPFGAECDCNIGYTLEDNGKYCQDYDECEVEGKCSQLCTNKLGTFECTCVANYSLDTDEFTCKATDPFQPFLVISNRDSLIRHNIREGSTAFIITHPDLAVGTDFNSAEGMIYWSDAVLKTISKTTIDGEITEELITTGLLLTESLAVDWVGGNLYWTDSELETIEVAKLDGSHRTVLFTEGISQPRGLVLDPRDGYRVMFWTDWGQSPRIEGAGMDGSNWTLVISSDLYWPNGLALDLPNDRLYFGDAGHDVIEYCNYDGSGRSVVLHSTQHLRHLHSLTVFENYVYWTDRLNDRISRVPKFLSSAENVTTVLSGLSDPLDLHTYHPAMQPVASNPCKNDPCSHLCLLSPNDMEYACICPVGTLLLPDNTCSHDLEPFLIYAQESQMAAIHLDLTDTSVTPMVPIVNLENVYDLDIDMANKELYWIRYEEDETRGTIHRVSLNGENATEFVPTAYVGAPRALAIDWISRNIYWTNPIKHTIEVIQMDGNNWRSVIISNANEPVSLCVDPINGKLYWADNGSPSKIVSANLDGSGVNEVVSDINDAIGYITIDIDGKNLYWTNIDANAIEVVGTDGSNQKRVVDGVEKPRGLAVYGNYLYYADAGYEKITRVFKTNGTEPVTMKNSLVDLQALRVGNQPAGSNSCSNNNGNCEHLCLPSGTNSIQCVCSTGFALNSDGTCSTPSSFAVVSQLSVIRGFSLESDEHDEAMVPVAGTDRYTLHVDVDVRQNYVYFADFYYGDEGEFHAIRRVHPDGSGLADIVTDGIGINGIRGLAVDWIAGNIYFTNAFLEDTFLEVCRLNGSSRRILYQTTLDKPRTIAVNPLLKFIYWCDYGQIPKIVRADLNSSNQVTLVISNINVPRDICVDMETNNVFWVDSETDTLERMSWDGSGRVTIRSDLPNPYGLAVLDNKVFWVDRTLEKIYWATKEPGSTSLADVFRSDLDSLRDIAIFNASIQPLDDSQNGCGLSDSNGDCEQLCFAQAGTSVMCMCAFGILSDDGKSCVSPTEFLVYSIQTELRSIHLDLTDLTQPIDPIDASQAIGVDFDFDTKSIYYTDISEHTINSISDSGNGPKTTILDEIDGVFAPEGIAHDWVNKRIFWTENSDGTVRSMFLSDEKNVKIVAQGSSPRAIVVHPCEGKVYWTDWQMFRIERASMTGLHREVVIGTNVIWPNGLTIDYEEEHLYWCDAYLDQIERSSLDGSNREMIIHAAIHPFSVTVFGDHIYWTDWSLSAVIRAEKHTGGSETTLVKELPNFPMDIHIVSSSRQSCDYSPCSVNNGGCTEECIPEGLDAVCQCIGDKKLAPDGKTCVASSSNCNNDQFWCVNGNCVPLTARCNKVDDCGDGSDESQVLCDDWQCQDTEFTCNNGGCIEIRFLCDHYNDCSDNSDEDLNICSFPTCNPATEWTCPTGRCISLDYRCDTYNDCNDDAASDEVGCPSRAPCPQYHTPCQTSNLCVLVAYLCDGEQDCLDGSDENPTICDSVECPFGWWKCTEQGACMPPYWHCDGYADCLDGSDEPASCTYPDATCYGSQFTCDNGDCVSLEVVCNGKEDCLDGSDEGGLSLNCADYTCNPYYFTCTSGHPLGPRCIDPYKVCDGEADCSDAEDENQPDCNRTTCNVDQFTCGNGLCIPLSEKCDHYYDCGDNSDEPLDCDYPTCTVDQFACDNQRCIPKNYQCDGTDDCGDKSDEKDFECGDPTCPPNQFMCNSGECINYEFTCNGNADCLDHSDETHCGINECDDELINQCSHECVNTATSFYCKCPEGQTLMEDQKACRDINECTETPWVCSQLCENTEGSYICKCAEGYAKEPDGITCRHTDDVEPRLLYSNRYYIRSMSLDGQGYTVVKDGMNNVVAMDFDYQMQTLYYADIPDDAIFRMYLNGTGLETIIGVQAPDTEGIAVDWVSRKLYFLDRETDRLDVAELDGSIRKTLVGTGMMEPRAIAVHPKIGYVYWTDWGLGNEQISRIGMDGQNMSKIIQDKLGWPNALTFDYSCDKMYWADAHLDVIESSFLDGSSRYRVIESGIAHPFAISVFESYMYWSDWNELRVYKANKMTGEEKQTLEETIHRPMDLHVYHPLRQLDWANPCGDDNGGCSHMCLITAGGQDFTCICPDDFLMKPDGKTCETACKAGQFLCVSHEKCVSERFQKCDGRQDCFDGSDEPASCPERDCDPGLYECPDGWCVPTYSICDGYNDCYDEAESDEQECEAHKCDDFMWKCHDDQRCIFDSWICDGFSDCDDNSDESDDVCVDRTCEPGYFTCDNGFCIPQAWYCDVDDDCGDASDEPQDICVTQSCDLGQFSCKENYRCIPEYAVCDGYNDCRDYGSDEDFEMCSQATCPVGDWQCDSFHCIPERWECDYFVDCIDGSDEVGCVPRECSESEFICLTSKICLPGSWKCDYEVDCEDGSDEADCPDPVCASNEWQCDSGHCIPDSYRCDIFWDCQDLSDEKNCSDDSHCLDQGFFACANSICIYTEWVCDGWDDCQDNSDETPSSCSLIDCDAESNRFKCTNGVCIPALKQCNGIDDCGDASDENDHDLCHVPPAECAADEYRCADEFCVSLAFLCDNHNDCDDGSDEIGCHKSDLFGCTNKNGGCKQNCTDTESGHLCHCNPGFILDPANYKDCMDINECVDGPNPCMQVCINKKGSFDCECADNYIDEGAVVNSSISGENCRAKGDSKYLLLTNAYDIRLLFQADNSTNDIYGEVITHEFRIEAIDYDYEEKFLYWTDSYLKSIKRGQMPSKDLLLTEDEEEDPNEELHTSNLVNPNGIAVDWIGRNLYWTDMGNQAQLGKIEVSRLDGAYRKTLITFENEEQPGTIVLDPESGWMYWINMNPAKPAIEMAHMNGENQDILVGSSHLEYPTGLALDFASSTRRLYWADEKGDLVGSVDSDGKNMVYIKTGGLNMPYRLEVFESFLYWTSKPTGYIYELDKLGRGVASNIEGVHLAEPSDIKVFHEHRYPAGPTRCKFNDDGTPVCSHLCLLIPNGWRCACPEGTDFVVGDTNQCDTAIIEPSCDIECVNGVCVADGYLWKCNCNENWEGDKCDTFISENSTPPDSTLPDNTLPDKGALSAAPSSSAVSPGMTAMIVVLVLVVLIVMAVLLLVYIRRNRGSHNVSTKEHGVSFRHGTNVDVDLGLEANLGNEMFPVTNGHMEFSLEDGSGNTQFANPVYRGGAEAQAAELQAEALPEKTALPPDNQEMLNGVDGAFTNPMYEVSAKSEDPDNVSTPTDKEERYVDPQQLKLAFDPVPLVPPAYSPKEEGDSDKTDLVEKSDH